MTALHAPRHFASHPGLPGAGMPNDRLARIVCETITINKSLAVVLGIAPLLILNLLYTAQFYAANALTGHAWVLLILGLVALLEFLLLQPVQRRLTRWQEPSHA